MARLYEKAKQVRKMIMDGVVDDGTVPTTDEIGDTLGISKNELRGIFKDLEAALVIAVQNKAHEGIEYFQDEKLEQGAPEVGEVFYARPFASFKNHYPIWVDGVHKWYGECAVEMCGVSAMFPDREVVVRSVCRQTGEPVEIKGYNGIILDYSPKTLRVHFGMPIRYMPDDIVGWCDYNSFFVSEEAFEKWRKSHPNIKGITRDPVTVSKFVGIVGKGRLGFDYQFKLPVLKMLLDGKRYGFTKPLPGIGFNFFDPFWLPSPHMLKSMKRNGYKNYIGFSIF